ncbi:MAG: neutral/alkaline non-lysosomal ceramidase N-terminal domain-containing protein, partial [Candidatus Hydrogenedentes bacterium]|nr:neutral/alkaline non-lysosomal ceramidase N-terminal domain-containing protein [Candidatus Hydrogenedentota bacterium]
MRTIAFLTLIVLAFPAVAQLNAGVAAVSITPLEKGIPTQLGGYGAREGKPATGILDTLHGKALVFEFNGRKSAVVTLDICSLPVNVVEDAVKKAAVDGLAVDRVIMAASHTHTGLEGAALDRRNVANNPHIGLFSEPMLEFVTDRLAEALVKANAALQPVTAASATTDLPNMIHNRRGDACVDNGLTALRLDKADGSPYAVLVNFTAHGTFVDDMDMLVSAEWAGSMQRTMEDLMEGVTCLYTNGAEGDQAPSGKPAGSRYEKAENYGRRVGIAAWNLVKDLHTAPGKTFALESREVQLPARTGHPDFVKVAGVEYQVTQDQLDALVQVMFPEKAPIYAFRIDDYMMVTFPGEPICEIGVAV